MGNKIQFKDHPDQLVETFLPQFQYQKRLADEQMVISLMCTTQKEGHIVTKFFLEGLIKNEEQEYKNLLSTQEQFEPRRHPNVLPLSPKFIKNEDKKYLVAYRQFVYYSLLEKMGNKIPKMELPEKQWLSYQLLCAIAQVHQQGRVHGDIKPENVLLTSYNQVFLTDLVSYKPTYVYADDHTSLRKNFGELNNLTRLYLAPERFIEERKTQIPNQASMAKPMDIFSAGCIIAEIMMEGEPLFAVGSLQSYRKDEFDPRQVLDKKIEDQATVNLIMEMISLKPQHRPDIKTCLQKFDQYAFPQSFSRCFYQLGSAFVRPQYLYSDMKLSLIRKYMPSIWLSCFGPDVPLPKLFEPHERVIFNKIREDNIVFTNDQLQPTCQLFPFMDLGVQMQIKPDPDSISVIAQWIGTFLPTSFYPQTRRMALEMLQVIGQNLDLNIRIQLILPYILESLKDKQPKVLAKAIEASTLLFADLLTTQENYKLAPMDYKIFDNYILPNLLRAQKLNKHTQLIQVTFTKYLPLLAKIGHRFTELAFASRLQEKQQKPSEDQQEQVVLVNFDMDIDILRKQFTSIIADQMALGDTTVDRLLFAKMGSLSDFYGSKVTMDNIIPLLGTCPNKKEHLVRNDCLKSVLGVGLKVGRVTLDQCMLLTFKDFLYDAEEIVVVQFIKTLVALLQSGLLSRKNILDDFHSNPNDEKKSLIDKLMPFLLHPNAWIREQTIRFMSTLCSFNQNALLSKAEVFCLVRNNLKEFLIDPATVMYFITGQKDPKDLLDLLQQPLSRAFFDGLVKASNKTFEDQEELRQTQSDRIALNKMDVLISATQEQYQKQMGNRTFSEDNVRPMNKFWTQAAKYSTFRVISIDTLIDLGMMPTKKTRKVTRFGAVDKHTLDKFQTKYYMPNKNVKDVERNNYGLNPKSDSEAFHLSQLDWIMEALNLFPDYNNLNLIKQKRQNYFSRFYSQQLIAGWRLQLCNDIFAQVIEDEEKPTPRSIMISKEKLTSKKFQIGDRKKATYQFRPEGRLITTLHEHKEPITSLAVTDDSSMFMSSSNDGQIHVWATADIFNDCTANSRFTVETNRKINKICCHQNSDYFAAVGDQSKLEIFALDRIAQDFGRNVSLPQNKTPNSCRLLQTLEHPNEGELISAVDTVLPVSHQHLLCYGSQRGSFFMHDLRCRSPFLEQKDSFQIQKGMLTTIVPGQDPYQLLCGTVAGYVMIYDIRFNMISSCFKHSNKYPINSLAVFKPNDEIEYEHQSNRDLNIVKQYNRSDHRSPLVMVASGGPSFELSLLNLSTGNVEYQYQVAEANVQEKEPISNVSSFRRISQIRDIFQLPEKSDTSENLYKRYLMQTRSLVSTHQIQLTQSLDDELFKSAKDRYRLLKQSNESLNGCRKVLLPRRWPTLNQATLTCDYAITGSNDSRIRYWSLKDPLTMSYYVNTPTNDECKYISSIVGGGTELIVENVSRIRNFPKLTANSLEQQQQVKYGVGAVEMAGDSIYYKLLNDMITQNYPINQNQEGNILTMHGARNQLTTSSANQFAMGSADQFQAKERQDDKLIIYNYNGLSEWQHFNGVNMNQGNATMANQSYEDYVKKKPDQKPRRDAETSKKQSQNEDEDVDYLYRDSQVVAHQDAITDLAVLEYSANDFAQAVPLLVSAGRDGKIKLWR